MKVIPVLLVLTMSLANALAFDSRDDEGVLQTHSKIAEINNASDVDAQHDLITHQGGLLLKWILVNHIGFSIASSRVTFPKPCYENGKAAIYYQWEKNSFAFLYIPENGKWKFNDIWIEKHDGETVKNTLWLIKEYPKSDWLIRKGSTVDWQTTLSNFFPKLVFVPKD